MTFDAWRTLVRMAYQGGEPTQAALLRGLVDGARAITVRDIESDLALAKSYSNSFREGKVKMAGARFTTDIAATTVLAKAIMPIDADTEAGMALLENAIASAYDDISAMADKFDAYLLQCAIDLQRHVPFYQARQMTSFLSTTSGLSSSGFASRVALPATARIQQLTYGHYYAPIEEDVAYEADDVVVSNSRAYKVVADSELVAGQLGAGLTSTDGEEEVLPGNMLLQSQTLATTPWADAFQVPETPAVQIDAPDGTETALLLNEDNDSGNSQPHSITQPIEISSESIYTASIYLRRNSILRSKGRLRLAAADLSVIVDAVYNLTTGTVALVTEGDPDDANATIESVGDSWYRVTATGKLNVSSAIVVLQSQTNAGLWEYPGSAASAGEGLGPYVWGAQLVKSTSALTYMPTTTAAIPDIGFTYYLPERDWPVRQMEWSARNRLVAGDFSGGPAYCFPPQGDEIWLYPKLDATHRFDLEWVGVTEDFADDDEVTFDRTAAEAAAHYIRQMLYLTEIDDAKQAAASLVFYQKALRKAVIDCSDRETGTPTQVQPYDYRRRCWFYGSCCPPITVNPVTSGMDINGQIGLSNASGTTTVRPTAINFTATIDFTGAAGARPIILASSGTNGYVPRGARLIVVCNLPETEGLLITFQSRTASGAQLLPELRFPDNQFYTDGIGTTATFEFYFDGANWQYSESNIPS